MPTRTRTDDLGLIDRTVAEKYCAHGQHWKPLRHFYRDRHRADGLKSRCKSCDRAYEAARRQGVPSDARYLRQRTWASESADYRAVTHRAQRAAETPQEREARRTRGAAYMRLYRARKAQERAATARARERALRRFYAHRDEMNAARRERHAEQRPAV